MENERVSGYKRLETKQNRKWVKSSQERIPDTAAFCPDEDTKRFRYYSQFFNTVEMDSTRK